MLTKLLLLLVIVIILLSISCVFVTNEGFVDTTNKCKLTKSGLKVPENCLYDECYEKSEGNCKGKCKWDNKEKKCINNTCVTHKTANDCNNDRGCVFNNKNNKCEIKDSNCNKIIPIKKKSITNTAGDTYLPQYNVHTVCPYNPKCLGICLNDFVWTDKNLNSLTHVPESAKPSINSMKNDNMKHLLVSSRCMECIKNFYTTTKLMKGNKCGKM